MCHIRLVIPTVLALLFVSNIQTATAQLFDNVVRIGVLNDQSSIYADFGGPGSVIAARMAVILLTTAPPHRSTHCAVFRCRCAGQGDGVHFTSASS
jgi:hypothetical protein